MLTHTAPQVATPTTFLTPPHYQQLGRNHSVKQVLLLRSTCDVPLQLQQRLQKQNSQGCRIQLKQHACKQLGSAPHVRDQQEQSKRCIDSVCLEMLCYLCVQEAELFILQRSKGPTRLSGIVCGSGTQPDTSLQTTILRFVCV